MKKIICTTLMIITVFILSSTASARIIEQGTIEIDGNFDISTSSRDNEFEGNFKVQSESNGIEGKVFNYVAPNLGLGLLIGHKKTEIRYPLDNYNGDTAKNSSTTTFFGPILKNNFSLSEKLSSHISLNLIYASTKDKTYNQYYNTHNIRKENGVGWGAGCGISYFVTDSVSLNGNADYQSIRYESDVSDFDDDYDYDYDVNELSFKFGVSVFFQ